MTTAFLISSEKPFQNSFMLHFTLVLISDEENTLIDGVCFCETSSCSSSDPEVFAPAGFFLPSCWSRAVKRETPSCGEDLQRPADSDRDGRVSGVFQCRMPS